MYEYVLVGIILVAVVLEVVGWIWAMLVARKISVGWLAAVAFLGMFAIPALGVQHWARARVPVLLFIVGFVALVVAAVLLPDHKA
jgi:hypothetical protein